MQGQIYLLCNHIGAPESQFHPTSPWRSFIDNNWSDYKDDGTNILLDANENAYGPGLALGETGALNGHKAAVDVDLLGLNRYPDPYALQYNMRRTLLIRIIATSTISSNYYAAYGILTRIPRKI